jgi:16S rRNA (guanine527-N7)-methyltransferase
MERRTTWLTSVAEDLGLGNVTVVRARAEEMHGRLIADVVTARAVAALDRLAGWCLPLTPVGGRLIAMKGSSAEREIEDARATIQRLGGAEPTIRTCGVAVLETPTTVVIIDKVAETRSRGRSSVSPKGAAKGRRTDRAAGGSGPRSPRRGRP